MEAENHIARLLVPAKEDIQHERLAQWMHTYKPTVVHLTPAMGMLTKVFGDSNFRQC